MDVVRCKNGHFFDGDSYDKCPHCGESAMTSGNNQAPQKEEKKGFWGRGKKEKAAVNISVNPTPPSSSPIDYDNGSSQTEVGSNSRLPENPPPPPPQQQKDHTLDFWQTSSHSESKQSVQETPDENKASANITPDEAPRSVKATVEHEERREEAPPMSSLKEAVRNASASNEGKTMSYFSAATSQSSSSQSQARQPADPVVGWLVCVAGYHFGECFSIFAGKNSIGRSSENRIVIADDNSISRVKHALIVYEPKKRNFYLQPGDSSGLTYLNDDYITDSHKLSAHDMIELGDSKFMFVQLCGETFSWDEYMPKGE